ncbi:DUF2278 family protein [Methanosarcina sp.]|uniref:DUF2278 family protein n=1 Tax=Methanosarcina sp. TaxID=2213 RepID=UPI003C78764E
MPLDRYGVLKGKAIDTRNGQGSSPHFQVKVSDDDLFRIAINVKSQVEPSTVLYYADEDFSHPILKDLVTLPFGFKELESQPGGMALDFIRGNLFDTARMKLLPHDLPGPDNDLNELFHKYVEKAISMETSEIYAFGQRWGPESKRDKYFGFKPGNGIHDIHMNQGNSEKWREDDGVWQDGGIIFHYPDENKWVAVFLAFQSQSFHTDDVTGHAIPEVIEKRVCIVAALVNPAGEEEKNATILNATPEPVVLDGWMLADINKMKISLQGTLNAGDTVKIPISEGEFKLPKEGGIITLLDDEGFKMDGVSYIEKEASKKGWTIVFSRA